MFNYGYMERNNKPSANFTDTNLNAGDHKLSQKAMQTWCLIRAMPFLLADKVDEDDDHMGLILYLLRIMELVFAPKLMRSSLDYLDELISDFIISFRNLFPDVDLINKFHHMTHYADCIAWSGPIVQFDCMRFEGKHNELKTRAQNVHNFKNPPKTLIRISQCVQSAKWGAADVKMNTFKVQNGKTHTVSELLSRQHLLDLNYEDDNQVFVATSVFYNGVEFRKGLFVLLETSNSRTDNLPLYSRIEEIVILPKNRCFLLTAVYETLIFDVSVHAFRIQIDPMNIIYRFVDVSTLPFYKPFSHWTKSKSSDFYISHRHIIL